jgi:hypothetical protein
MSEPSPAATLFLIAIDPKTGRLVQRRRLRFRRALRRAGGSRRRAVRELRRLGLVARSPVPGRHPLVPGSKAGAPFARLRRGIETGFEHPQDATVFVLLAWSGVLRRRLTRSELWHARHRLRQLNGLREDRYVAMDEASPEIHALGQIAYHEQMDVLQEAVGDLLTGGDVTFDLGGGGDGGGGGGGDGGGGDGT